MDYWWSDDDEEDEIEDIEDDENNFDAEDYLRDRRRDFPYGFASLASKFSLLELIDIINDAPYTFDYTIEEKRFIKDYNECPGERNVMNQFLEDIYFPGTLDQLLVTIYRKTYVPITRPVPMHRICTPLMSPKWHTLSSKPVTIVKEIKVYNNWSDLLKDDTPDM